MTMKPDAPNSLPLMVMADFATEFAAEEAKEFAFVYRSIMQDEYMRRSKIVDLRFGEQEIDWAKIEYMYITDKTQEEFAPS